VRRLFLDCDGVLADFDRAFLELLGVTPRAYEDANGSTTFWRVLQSCEPGFYRELPLMPGAMDLFHGVQHYRPLILTGCPEGGWAQPQKLAWAAERFPGIPMVVTMSRDKRAYCQPGDVLVDDWPKYRPLWEEAGGVFIPYHGHVLHTIAAVVAAMERL
jgi:5'(3')-deoxyribonucleotidase